MHIWSLVVSSQQAVKSLPECDTSLDGLHVYICSLVKLKPIYDILRKEIGMLSTHYEPLLQLLEWTACCAQDLVFCPCPNYPPILEAVTIYSLCKGSA